MKRKKIKKIDGGNRSGAPRIKQAKGKKAQEFIGQNIDKETTERGMKIEEDKAKRKDIIFWGLAAAGIVLIILGIHDNELKFDGLGISLSCSLVGVMIAIVAIIAIILNNPKIHISNDR